MKYVRQFWIILLISAMGEALHVLIPLPVPASVYGLVIMLIALGTHIIRLEQVKEAAEFLIEIMPVMFIPAGVGLLTAWGILKPVCVPIILITVITTVVVMIVTGRVTPGSYSYGQKERTEKIMTQFMSNSLFFGAAISLIAYEAGLLLKRKFKMAIFNPLLIAIIAVIAVLCLLHIDYDTYNQSGQYISYLLTPATVCLAVPLYQQMELLKKNLKAVIIGIVSGVLASLVSVLILAKLFSLSHEQYVTLLPKSITTAIGMGVSEELGGIVTITVAVIIITGVLGNMIAETVIKLARIEEPIAKGLALGTSAHAIGTAKAMELGEIEGAMSSLAIAGCRSADSCRCICVCSVYVKNITLKSDKRIVVAGDEWHGSPFLWL